MAEGSSGRRVAYLTGEYPRATDTFIQREVAALRTLGVEILTCSVRRTAPGQLVGPEQRAEDRATFHVIEAGRSPLRLLGAHAAAFAAAPRRYLSTLGLALRSAAPGLRGFALQLAYFAEAAVLAGHLRRERVRHLHNHFGDSSCTVAMLAAGLAGLPFSVTIHGPAEFFALEKWRLDIKIARAAFVACISHFCRSQLMLISPPEQWDKLHVVRCGVLPERYGRDPAAGPGNGRIVFVGRLAAAKGVPVLLDAFRTVRASHPEATLTLVGDGPERPAIEARIAALGLSEAVEITGFLSQAEVAGRLARSDVFVLPSFAEGLPVVLMEAMASGLPVVATRIAGVAELVEDGISGLLVPPGDADSLAAGLSALLCDPGRRAAMGRHGRGRVEAAFDVRAEAARLRTLLEAPGR